MNSYGTGATVSHAGQADDQIKNSSIYGLIFVILVVVGRIQEIIPGLGKLYLGKISFAVAIFLFATASMRNRSPLFGYPQMRYLIWLLALGLLSAPFGYWPTKSFNFMLYIYGTQLLMVVLLVRLVVSYRDFVRIIWGVVLAITLLSGAALVLTQGGRASASSTYDPNDLAFYIVCLMPLLYYQMKSRRGIGRVITAGSLIICFGALLATQSRSGFLGFVVIVLATMIREKVGIFKILAGAAAIAVVLIYFSPEGYTERMATIVNPQEDYNLTAGGGRIAIWKRGLKVVMSHPLLGVGPDTFFVAEGKEHVEQGGKWSVAHNSFIQIAAEFGIAGFVLFIMTMVASLRSLARIRRELALDSRLRWAVLGVEIGFYGYITSGFFLSQAYASSLFLLIGLTMNLQNLAQLESAPSPNQQGSFGMQHLT